MQTFLPYPCFERSVAVLDRKRLGKQRLEAHQILGALSGQSTGWKNHPATKMWAGHVGALKVYYNDCLREWERRGYYNNLLRYIWIPSDESIVAPPWFGNEAFHLSHRSNLLRKLPEHYRIYWPDDPDDLPYVWPGGHTTLSVPPCYT